MHSPKDRLSPPDRWDVSFLKERLADKIKEVYASPQGDVFAEVAREHVLEVAKALHAEGYDYCAEVTAVDYSKHKSYKPGETPRFNVVYVLYSTSKNTQIILRVPVPEDGCKAPSLAPIWKGADWFEREVYDLMGVTFEGHPDLRRIMTWEGYEGHPERKDFPWRDPEWESPWRKRHPGKV